MKETLKDYFLKPDEYVWGILQALGLRMQKGMETAEIMLVLIFFALDWLYGVVYYSGYK